ncbi:MAG: hypothetical protein WBP45_02665 [Daejeonella sp.]
MSKSKKRAKVIRFFISFIGHDFGAYNSIWKWDDIPDEIKSNYELIEEKLKEWEAQGHIRIFMEGGERMIEIISVPEG